MEGAPRRLEVHWLAPVLGALLMLTAATAVPASLARPAAAAAPGPPNVVIIVSDDQPKGVLAAMPTVESDLALKGLTLTNGVIPTSLCCPSRASLLTGNYAHTTGVYGDNATANGGWSTFYRNGTGPEQQTLATELQSAGYQTALFGKYLNDFAAYRPNGYIPPGWDTFAAIGGDNGGDGTYYNYTLLGNVGDPTYSSAPSDYSTDVTAQMASQFIEQSDPAHPIFLYWAPFGPHGPATPAPRHIGVWPRQSMKSVPAFNEGDVSDKPAWVASLPKVDVKEQRRLYTRIHEAVMSIDDGVSSILSSLSATGRLSNTLVIYLSDNGLMLGSHRLTHKDVPYQMSSEVDMFLRWDGVIAPGSVSRRVTPQIDLTAAIKEATGMTGWPMEGRSVLSTGRTGTVLEQESNDRHPAYCGYRTRRYVYTQYASDSDELYDLRFDHQEKQNVANDPDYDSVRTMMRQKTMNTCSPTPPGFSWN